MFGEYMYMYNNSDNYNKIYREKYDCFAVSAIIMYYIDT